MRNLLDNALRHSPTGGIVRVSAEAGEGEVRVRVRDEGQGVPPEERERVFLPFHRSPQERSGTGAGLGLTIARQLARRHGGDVTMDEGEGACFVVSLPRAAAEREA